MPERIFEHFPESDAIKCPICGTNRDAPCVLVAIDGTDEGWNCEASPTHVDCLTKNLEGYRYNKKIGIIYKQCEGRE